MENEVKKIKVQKRTPTEKQLESLEKARLSKQKKKIIKEHTQSTEPSSFLSPPPYMTGLILLGCAGLAAYSLLKGQKSYPTMEDGSTDFRTRRDSNDGSEASQYTRTGLLYRFSENIDSIIILTVKCQFLIIPILFNIYQIKLLIS